MSKSHKKVNSPYTLNQGRANSHTSANNSVQTVDNKQIGTKFNSNQGSTLKEKQQEQQRNGPLNKRELPLPKIQENNQSIANHQDGDEDDKTLKKAHKKTKPPDQDDSFKTDQTPDLEEKEVPPKTNSKNIGKMMIEEEPEPLNFGKKYHQNKIKNDPIEYEPEYSNIRKGFPSEDLKTKFETLEKKMKEKPPTNLEFLEKESENLKKEREALRKKHMQEIKLFQDELERQNEVVKQLEKKIQEQNSSIFRSDVGGWKYMYQPKK